jgi:hypothetical protein
VFCRVPLTKSPSLAPAKKFATSITLQHAGTIDAS